MYDVLTLVSGTQDLDTVFLITAMPDSNISAIWQGLFEPMSCWIKQQVGHKPNI